MIGAGDQNQCDPNCSQDCNLLVFGGQILPESDATRVNAIRIFDLKTHQVSVLPGSEGLWSPRWSTNGRSIMAMTAGGWMGIDPGDAPLLVRDAGTQDIHALTLDLP